MSENQESETGSIGSIIEGKITGITKYGAFVELDGKNSGMIHISEISSEFVRDINEMLKVGQRVKAIVLKTNEDGKLALSIRQLPNAPPSAQKEESRDLPEEKNTNFKPPASFEDMMSKFKRDSEEKISDLKFLEPKRSGQPRRRKD